MKKRLVIFCLLTFFSISLIQCQRSKPIMEDDLQKVQTKSYTIESIRTSTQVINAKESIYELQYTCIILNSDTQDSKILTVTPILKTEFKPYVTEEKPLTLEVNQTIRTNEKITLQGKFKFQSKKVSEEIQKTWSPYVMGFKILNEKSVLVEKETESKGVKK